MAKHDKNPSKVIVKNYIRNPPTPGLVTVEVLYALIDEASLDESGMAIGHTLILDTIPKITADIEITKYKKGNDLSAIDCWHPKVFQITGENLRKFLQLSPESNTNTWLKLSVCQPGAGALTMTHLDLGTAVEGQEVDVGTPVTITPKIRLATVEEAQNLDQIAMLEAIPDTSSTEIESALNNGIDKNSMPMRVAVYDVGQANCNAVVDANIIPRMYFDLGWPWSSKAMPPSTPTLLDLENEAPVVLSHWDFDHWSYALDKVGFRGKGLKVKDVALNRFWIARRPEVLLHKLGPTHIAFAIELSKRQKLLIWPKDVKNLSTQYLKLIACKKPTLSPLPNDRNNNGLAMLLLNDTGNILMTGDADYSAMTCQPGNEKTTDFLSGMVVPHHGGTLYSPPPSKPSHATTTPHAVVSAHTGNIYGHPSGGELLKCMTAGWQISCTMDAHSYCERTIVVPLGCTVDCEGKKSNACRLVTYGVTRDWYQGVTANKEALSVSLPTKDAPCQRKLKI